MADASAVLDLRRAAAAERRRVAEDRWRRFQDANRRRYAHRAGRLAPEPLARLLARGKAPGRALLLAASGAWHVDLEQALGAAGGETLGLLGYVRAGPTPDAQPRALFDQAWYLERAPALASGRWAPLAHYLVLGDLEGRSPHPLVNARWARRPGSGLTALQDFLFEGAAKGRAPHPLFDVRHYVGQCEAVAQTGENPLIHYLREGWRDGLDPHPLFANAWYLGHAAEAGEAGIAPLLHYVTRGAAAGADPHPLFESACWGGEPRRPTGVDDPLSDYLLSPERTGRSPTPRFDPAFYVAQAGEAARADPLLHYLTVGTFEGLSPSAEFEEPAWFAAHPRAAGEVRSGLELAFRRGPCAPAAKSMAPAAGAGAAQPTNHAARTDLEVTLVGYPFSPSGMGEHLRVTLKSLQAAGVGVRLVDLAGLGAAPDPAWAPLEGLLAGGLGPLNVFCVNADEIDRVTATLRREAFTEATNVVFPAWELARYPAPYAQAVSRFDEIWAPSTFVRDAIAAAVERPVHVIPLAVEPKVVRPLSRRWFGIPERAFTVLFFFDFASHHARKNPEAVLDAFERLAAHRPEADLHCVIKVRGVPPSRAARDALLTRVAALGDRAQVLEGDFSDEEIKSLVRACDVFVSLHRSEGFGFGAAEAMALGRVAVATGYSGNLDFMQDGTSLLVDYELVPVAPGAYPHGEGQVWAEPSAEHAARLIEGLLDDPDSARALAERGRRHIAETLSYAAVGARLAERVQALARRQTTGSSER